MHCLTFYISNTTASTYQVTNSGVTLFCVRVHPVWTHLRSNAQRAWEITFNVLFHTWVYNVPIETIIKLTSTQTPFTGWLRTHVIVITFSVRCVCYDIRKASFCGGRGAICWNTLLVTVTKIISHKTVEHSCRVSAPFLRKFISFAYSIHVARRAIYNKWTCNTLYKKLVQDFTV